MNKDQRPETRDQGPGNESPEVLALAKEIFDVGMRELFAKKLCTRVYTWEERIGTNSLICLAIARHVVATRPRLEPKRLSVCMPDGGERAIVAYFTPEDAATAVASLSFNGGVS